MMFNWNVGRDRVNKYNDRYADRFMAKILIAEDDAALAGQLDKWLTAEKHTVDVVHDGQKAGERLRFYDYDVVVLDWELPKVSGIQVCKDYRSQGGKTPVLILTGKGAIDEKETGLDSGADDYLTKPFHLKELSARLRALLRRPSTFTGSEIRIGTIVLEPKGQRVTRDGAEIQLLPKEFALLEFFVLHRDVVVDRAAITAHVWDENHDPFTNVLEVLVRRLRRKIDDDFEPKLIHTLRGAGYRFGT